MLSNILLIVILGLVLTVLLMNMIWVIILYQKSEGLSKVEKLIFAISNPIAIVLVAIAIFMVTRLFYHKIILKKIQTAVQQHNDLYDVINKPKEKEKDMWDDFDV
jgi:hypothetical protein